MVGVADIGECVGSCVSVDVCQRQVSNRGKFCKGDESNMV